MRLRNDTKIHIARDGAALEPRSVAEASRQLSEHKLQPGDLAWCEGLSDWVPLTTLVSLAEAGNYTDEKPLTKDSPFRSTSEGKLRIRRVGGMGSIFSLLNRNVKKERVNSEELGRGLWAFCKAASRDFHVFFKQVLLSMDVELSETQEYDASQEIVLMNLWLISRELPKDKRSVITCHQSYILAQGRVAGMVGSVQDQMRAVEECKATLISRCTLFHEMWHGGRRANELALAKHLLGYILNSGRPHALSSNKLLLAHVHNYLRAMPRTIHEMRRRFVLTD